MFYFGNLKNQKKDGFGVAFWSQSGDVYVGYWKEGYQTGLGAVKRRGKLAKYGYWLQGMCDEWITEDKAKKEAGSAKKAFSLSREVVEKWVKEVEEENEKLLNF